MKESHIKINAITSFYISSNKIRAREIMESLGKNIKQSIINRIHLFLDKKEDLEYILQHYRPYLENGKVKIVRIGLQPTYTDFLHYVNDYLNGELCMVMNSDIWLHSISDMRLLENMENRLYGLTRHEGTMEAPLIDHYNSSKGFIGSQDAFIFKSPVASEVITKLNFPQNVWGSDNVLLREFKNHGYQLYNPCRQIVIIHEHASGERGENRQRLPPPWITLKPGYLEIQSHSPKENDTHILSIKESNAYIVDQLQKGTPVLISRLGIGAETIVSYNAMHHLKISHSLVDNLSNNAGIYLESGKENKLISLFVKHYVGALKDSVGLACFSDNTIIEKQQLFFSEKFGLDKIHSRSLGPFYAMSDGLDPWTKHLVGKKILIVHPFVETMKNQRESGFKLFGDTDIFDANQEFIFYKSFNTIAGNHCHRHWYETFLVMCKEIKKLDFDIALLGCGGYGLPLSHYIKSKLNKSALYIGGELQLFFGIMGKQWIKNDYWIQHRNKYGTQFVIPDDNKDKVENGCYWLSKTDLDAFNSTKLDMVEDKQNIPVVIIHTGYTEYLKVNLDITGKNNTIILVGDESLRSLCEHYENVTFVSIHKYYDDKNINHYKECFVNYSSNNSEIEWFGYLKIFILKLLMEDLKLDQVFHITSNTVLLKTIESCNYLFEKNNAFCIPINPAMRMNANINSALISKELCYAFTDLYEGIYITKDKKNLIDEKIDMHYDKDKGDYMNGGVCVGTLLYLLYAKGIIEVQNLLVPCENKTVFMNGIMNSEGADSKEQYKMKGVLLNIEHTEDGKNMIFDIVQNQSLDTINVHFQGNSRELMTQQLKTVLKF